MRGVADVEREGAFWLAILLGKGLVVLGESPRSGNHGTRNYSPRRRRRHLNMLQGTRNACTGVLSLACARMVSISLQHLTERLE